MSGRDEDAVQRAKRLQRDERRRVKGLIERDRGDAAREDVRKLAELEVRAGVFVNLDETVVAPTPEWLSHHQVSRFTPKQHDKTVRSVSTVRRASSPVVTRLLKAHKIGWREAGAAIRYRDTWDMAGYDGKVASSQYSLTATIRGSSIGDGMTITEFQEVARNAFHRDRCHMDYSLRNFFDAIVLEDTSLRSAARLLRCRNGEELENFNKAAEQLADHYERLGLDMTKIIAAELG